MKFFLLYWIGFQNQRNGDEEKKHKEFVGIPYNKFLIKGLTVINNLMVDLIKFIRVNDTSIKKVYLIFC